MTLRQSEASLLTALALLFTATSPLLADTVTPGDWLDKMASAVQTTNYEGTVVRSKDGNSEALKVVHIVSDGVVREKVLIQEGNGLEIIRNGNEVHCILPDKKSVLVEEWNEQSTLFSTLPSSDVRFGSEYDVSIVRQERVAGRKSVLLAIRPHDEYRFGHRIWLDVETGLPLQTKLVESGQVIEQVKFADIRIDPDLQVSALQPSYSTEDFRWYTQPRRALPEEIETDWNCSNLPAGFKPIATHAETSHGSVQPVTHILYSDGLARVSVFIEASDERAEPMHSRVGASNSFRLANGEVVVTAVGEVPAATVEQIARSMHRD